MRYSLIVTCVLVLFSGFVGCNGTADSAGDSTVAGGTNVPTVKDDLQANVGQDAAENENSMVAKGDPSDSGSSAKKNSVANSNRKSKADSNMASKVDHQDPTSYPVTKLDAKEAGQIAMLSWNVESDGSEAETICDTLTELNAGDRYDIVALTEVLPENLKKFRIALGMHYKYAYSKSGRNDRMQILFNENRFEKVKHFEIQELNYNNRYRAPMVALLKERKTEARPSEMQFMVMVNHLVRGKAELRQKQATALVDWARKQNQPVFALGDYNFDYVFETDKGNRSFTNFMQDNVWRWVTPTEMVDTNWYDDPESPDGKDDYPGSMLDFAFVAGSAKDWQSTCTIIVREGDFPDDKKKSDHRPYELITTAK